MEAADTGNAQALEALGQLCAEYRLAIVAYFRVKAGEAAGEDLAHDFLARLLERNRLLGFEPQTRTRFRHYLLAALRHFWADHRAAQGAAKRGRGSPALSLDQWRAEHDLEPPDDSPDLAALLDAQVALATHQQALARLSEHCRDEQQRDRLAVLRPFFLFELVAARRADLARRLGLSHNALHQALFRLREAYYDAFRAEVARIVRAEDVDAEMRHLVELLPAVLATPPAEG